MALKADLDYNGLQLLDAYVTITGMVETSKDKRDGSSQFACYVGVYRNREKRFEGNPVEGLTLGNYMFVYDPRLLAGQREQAFDALRGHLIEFGATNIRDVLEDEAGTLPAPPVTDEKGEAPLVPCCVRIRHDNDGKIVLSSQYAALDGKGNPCVWLSGQRDDLADDLAPDERKALDVVLAGCERLNRDSLPAAKVDEKGVVEFVAVKP